MQPEKMTIGSDNICPKTSLPCDDETCNVKAEPQQRKPGERWKEYSELPLEVKNKLFTILEPYIFLSSDGHDVVFDADAMMAMKEYTDKYLPSSLEEKQREIEGLKAERDDYKAALQTICDNSDNSWWTKDEQSLHKIVQEVLAKIL